MFCVGNHGLKIKSLWEPIFIKKIDNLINKKCRLNAERVSGSRVVWLPKCMPGLHVAGVQVTAWTWDFFSAFKISVTCLFRTPCTQALGP